MPRIGVLYPGNTGTGTGTEGLRQGLRELGYVEGRTAVIEWRWREGKPERLREAVAEMVRLNLDVIVVGGSEGTKAVKEPTQSVPIVFSGPSYPVEEGLVEFRAAGWQRRLRRGEEPHVHRALRRAFIAIENEMIER